MNYDKWKPTKAQSEYVNMLLNDSEKSKNFRVTGNFELPKLDTPQSKYIDKLLNKSSSNKSKPKVKKTYSEVRDELGREWIVETRGHRGY